MIIIQWADGNEGACVPKGDDIEDFWQYCITCYWISTPLPCFLFRTIFARLESRRSFTKPLRSCPCSNSPDLDPLAGGPGDSYQPPASVHPGSWPYHKLRRRFSGFAAKSQSIQRICLNCPGLLDIGFPRLMQLIIPQTRYMCRAKTPDFICASTKRKSICPSGGGSA